jgi:hypothetical protein
MLKLNNLKDALTKFGDDVVADAKANLQKSGKVDTGELSNSIQSTGAVFHRQSIELGISLSYYGAFVEKGVRGAGGVRMTTSTFQRTNNKGKLWKQKGGNSPYSYKEGIKPSVKHFVEWSNKRGLNPFAIRESVYRQGISPTPFLGDAVKKNIGTMPTQLKEAFALDVQTTIDFIIKSNFNNK